jgi:putative ATPase
MKKKSQPLADLIRPQALKDVIGQDHLFEKNAVLQIISETKNVPSMILFGPTGVGKTTIAKALAQVCDADFIMISAINSGAADIRKIIDSAIKYAGKTILMVDEIHHFNKTQQDLFLPFIENGSITLIGTTTENPSFHLNSALLSRCKVVELKILDEIALEKILQRAEEKHNKQIPLTSSARETLISLSCGDARYLLNACEELMNLSTKEKLETEELQKFISKRAAAFDKKGDFHFNLISAFHKSLRGSDVNAALYYLARMLIAKQDPYYILRRLARFATEDIGTADPNALLQVMAAKENYDFLGSPEGDYALSYATIYCATAPKSNSSYVAHKMAMEFAQNSTHQMAPIYICDSSYVKKITDKNEIKNSDSDSYIYDHDTVNCFSGQEYFPKEAIKKSRPKFYQPNERGFERYLKKRLEYWAELKKKNTNKN